MKSHVVVLPPLEEQQRLTADWRREQATFAGVSALKAKFETRLTARLAAVWGAAPTTETSPVPASAAAVAVAVS